MAKIKWKFNHDRAIEAITSTIIEAMDSAGVSRTDLAKRLGVTQGLVSKMLSGQQNMTVGTASSILAELGFELRFEAKPVPKRPR